MSQASWKVLDRRGYLLKYLFIFPESCMLSLRGSSFTLEITSSNFDGSFYRKIARWTIAFDSSFPINGLTRFYNPYNAFSVKSLVNLSLLDNFRWRFQRFRRLLLYCLPLAIPVLEVLQFNLYFRLSNCFLLQTLHPRELFRNRSFVNAAFFKT